jgi:hypothetical protein
MVRKDGSYDDVSVDKVFIHCSVISGCDSNLSLQSLAVKTGASRIYSDKTRCSAIYVHQCVLYLCCTALLQCALNKSMLHQVSPLLRLAAA